MARTPRPRWILGLVAVAVGCSSTSSTPPVGPSSPPAPSSEPIVLKSVAIVPSVSEIVLGATMSLQAIGHYSDGREMPVAATWASDNPVVLEVDPNGRLSTHRLGAATIAASVDQLSDARRVWVTPGQDAPFTGDFSGRWEGGFLVASCERVSGPGPSICRSLVGGVSPIRLELTQQRNAISGSVALYSDLRILGSVTGWVDGNGTLVLDGTYSIEEQSFQGRLYNWDSHLDSSGHMAGSFAANEHFTNAFGPQVMEYRNTVSGLTRR